MIAVSLNIGRGVRLIKQAKLYVCMQTHYKHDGKDGRMVQGVRSHGSLPLSHWGSRYKNWITHTFCLNNLKDLDPPYKTNLDLWDCFGRKIKVLQALHDAPPLRLHQAK